IFAGENPGAHEIAGLGVGGLLAEIPGRPQPRDMRKADAPEPLPVAVILLAAGAASRMDGRHKLLAEFDGIALVRRAAEAAPAARPGQVVVVTGHRAEEIEAALSGLPVEIVRNRDHALGMSASLGAGVAALAPDYHGAVILLADMPNVTGKDILRLIEAFRQAGGHAVVRAVAGGQREI